MILMRFIRKFQNYKDEYFVYYLSGEELDLNSIRTVMKDKEKFESIVLELPWVVGENTDIYYNILYETEHFKQQITGLFEELNNEYFSRLIESSQQEYIDALDAIRSELASRKPIEVVSEILHRKIEEEANVREYFFIPSLFVAPHYIIISNKYARLTIYDMRAGFKSEPITKAEALAKNLNVISDKTRLELLRLLILQQAYGKLLADRLNLSTATISHHLEQLKKYSLVAENRNKNIKYFSANMVEIDKLMNGLRDYLFNK